MALSPGQLKNIPNNMVKLYQDLEDFIIKDFVRRLLKAGKITSTAEWIAFRANEIGISTNDIKKEIERITKLSESEINKLFKESAIDSINADNEIFKNGGLNTVDIEKQPFLKECLQAARKQTNGELKNFTNSLGFAEVINGKVVYSTLASFYQKHLDLAQMKIINGVSDYNSAIKQAIKVLTNSGVRHVNFPSGWSNRLDVAVRRAVMTGINQMASKMVDYNCDLLGLELIEVSAHSGARPSHQDWQGQVYTRGVATKDYENFEDATEYGEGNGLCGWNCRHSYSPFMEGSPRTYSKQELEDMKNAKVDYNGKTYTEYEASQYQRRLEAAMRKSKREILAYDKAGLKDDFRNVSIKLQQQRKEYNNFAKATGMKKQNARHQVDGFGKSISQKSVQPYKQVEKQANKLYNLGSSKDNIKAYLRDKTIRDKIQSLDKNIHIGKQGKHIKGHNNYIEGRSYLTISIDEMQVLINKYSGTGILDKDRSGNFKNKELIIYNKNIGANINNITKEETKTNRFYIHYSKGGTHIVPTLKGVDRDE